MLVERDSQGGAQERDSSWGVGYLPEDLAPEGEPLRGGETMLSAPVTRAATVAAVVAAYHWMIRPRVLNWGATAAEADRELPGDEISPPTPLRSTMAITIDAPPEKVWPWVVQQGWQRGGFYSYNRIEHVFGLDLHNADTIHAEWQDLKVGDTIWMSHPRLKMVFPRTQVARIDRNRALVLAIMPPDRLEGDTPSGAWSFVLEPVGDHSTRLLARLQVLPGPHRYMHAYYYATMEPAHAIMQPGGLRGIKERAERPEM